MRTQFDRLVLSSDRKTITASGAITWEPGDDHCKIHVVLSQNNGAINGTGDTPNYGTDDPSWECDVQISTPHNGQWDPSLQVHCVGTAQPPTSAPWPPQDLPLQTRQTAPA